MNAPASRPAESYDVLIVGYGPAGMVLSALLGSRGHRVGVIERYAGLYNLPRAATFDDDAMRLLQKLGIAERVAVGTRVQRSYNWCNAEGETLIGNEFSDFGRSGWPEFNMMFQPVLERELDDLCRRTPGVEIVRGRVATDFRQTGDAVEVVARPADELGRAATGSEDRAQGYTARFAVGCDGGNSSLRSSLGIEIDDYGFQEPWLVCDFRLTREVDLPMALQYGDPEQPTSIISIGPHHHRFSFMLDEAVSSAEAVDPAQVWQRVKRWITPEDAELIRVAPYTFRSTVAREWKQGRFLLAGDAAHQMPPFLGQGMCSGLRDAHNLAWKLDLVLRGADEKLLDTYAAERSPHVRAITEKAVELGRIQTIRDKRAARLRDEELLRRKRAAQLPEGFRFPGYDAGFLAAAAPGDSARGKLFPQAWVAHPPGRRQRFDDVSGSGWLLLARDAAVIADRNDDLDAWRTVGGAVLVLGASADSEFEAGTAIDDVDDAYRRWFDEHACVAVVVRPDWYVYGSAASADSLGTLLRACVSDLCPQRPVPSTLQA
ncbi:bifunctional 3-(3-hydroxy-phenyl)propionate/3-hydroxycinnamic acid hydroxylase [Amycolatopsis sp. CA-128772]|uniref:bifunctional 3-(3-hydroxy-phenyl)propionate/3-hydroxycinnamic acid hydroxylase MhpA n=1 Tax=Amycolatopsis sp. CA-128772 TaxID=2073159 RepID=UPI001304F84D|nr:bifunctional 3-(3-hydroxy-phenyl)propionate/3-hydroxycinnamic acid hydroxylase [Amycolatopsis sp. CA-128772]